MFAPGDEGRSIEAQAIGRAFRQGQTKTIVVARFVIENTCEEEQHTRNTRPVKQVANP